MRVLLALMVSVALMYGCADESSNAAGSGGAGGAGGVAGEGGAGGEGAVNASRAYVALFPMPPCEEGVASSYYVESIFVGAGSIEASFPNCAKVPTGAGFTLMCPADEDRIDYEIFLARDGALDVRANGEIEACNGFLLRDVIPAADEVVADVFVAPAPPCEEGVPSDYTIDVFVEGESAPVIVRGTFGDCTGSIDSNRNTITCPNDEPSIPYSITLGEGLDWEVTIMGTWETCGGFLLR